MKKWSKELELEYRKQCYKDPQPTVSQTYKTVHNYNIQKELVKWVRKQK